MVDVQTQCYVVKNLEQNILVCNSMPKVRYQGRLLWALISGNTQQVSKIKQTVNLYNVGSIPTPPANIDN